MQVLLAEPDRLWTAEYRAALAVSRAELLDLLLQLDASLSAKQRTRAERRLLALAAELRDLAQHVFTEHQDDQQAVQTLQEFFARLNSAAQMQAQAEAAYRRQAQTQGGAAPASPFGGAPSPFDAPQAPAQEEKSSGLWTPGSDSGSSNGGSRLIIPD